MRLLLMLVLCLPSWAAFTQCRAVTIDHAKVTATQSNFTVLVALTDAALKTTANGGEVTDAQADDVGFFSDSGCTTAIAWDLEHFDGTAGTVKAWVKIASVSSATDTVFYIGIGDAGITTYQSTRANAYTNPLAVYNFPDGSTLSLADVGGGSLDLTNNSSVGAASGQIDGAADFSGSNYLTKTSVTALTSKSAYTIAGWFNPSSIDSYYGIINAAGSGVNVQTYSTNGFVWDFDTGIYHRTYTFNFFPTNAWTFAVFVFDGSQSTNATRAKAYRNGSLHTTNADYVGTIPATTLSGSGTLTLAPANAGRWTGKMDAIHIYSDAKSADWVATAYNNQSSPETFLSLAASGGGAAGVRRRIIN